MKKTSIVAGAILCVLSGVACQKTRPLHLNPDFGSSARLMVENQILDPEAPVDDETVEGIDGTASQKLIHQYHKSFEGKREQTKSVGFVIAPTQSKK